MGSGMNVDRLFGGTDLKTYEETGKLEYLVENSFMNQEYVIFEEMLDAPDYILEQLKDILSSGEFRNGNQIFRIKTKLIICNTNHTREDFTKKNNSLKALMERFPLEHKVEWATYSKETYTHLLVTVLGGADPALCYIMGEYAKNDKIISPRIAIKSAVLVHKYGLDSIKYIAEFNRDLNLMAKAINNFKSFKEIKELSDKLNVISIKCRETKVSIQSSISEIRSYSQDLISYSKTIAEMKNLKTDEALIEDKNSQYKQHSEVYKNLNTNLEIITKQING